MPHTLQRYNLYMHSNSKTHCYSLLSALKVCHLPEMHTPYKDFSPPATRVAEEHNYAVSLRHPITSTTDRFIVGDRFHDGPKVTEHKRITCQFHNMKWCPELIQYQSVTSEVINSKIKSVRLQSSSQQNIYHYFFYNRLMDHWHNEDIVQRQRKQMEVCLMPGEVITRDFYHRLVYACATCRQPGHKTQQRSKETR